MPLQVYPAGDAQVVSVRCVWPVRPAPPPVHWVGPANAGFPPGAKVGDTAGLGDTFWRFDGDTWTRDPDPYGGS